MKTAHGSGPASSASVVLLPPLCPAKEGSRHKMKGVNGLRDFVQLITDLYFGQLKYRSPLCYYNVVGPLNGLVSCAGAPQMAMQTSQLKSAEAPAEQTLSAGINRAYQIFGPNLAAFFEAVKADIRTGEHKGVQLTLPLMKSK